MSTRVFVGNLNRRATERDVEKFFRGYGKIQDVILKTGFGFVDFADNRDAEDAVHEMNGKDLCGDRVTVEMSRPRGEGGPRGRGGRGGYDGGDFRGGGGYGGGRDFGARGGGGGGGDFNNRRVGRPPNLTEFRVTVENLSSRVSWQDLKDLMSKAGEVTFADAHKRNDNSGIVCFGSLKDMKRAIEKFDGHELNGRKLKMVQEYKERNSSRSRSRSHSRSDRSRSKGSERRSRSRSRSASSHEASRSSKSKSPSGPPNDD